MLYPLTCRHSGNSSNGDPLHDLKRVSAVAMYAADPGVMGQRHSRSSLGSRPPRERMGHRHDSDTAIMPGTGLLLGISILKVHSGLWLSSR